MLLEDFPKGFKPFVQPIDTWFLNRRLAMVFEAKVGNGKLIVSSANLSPTLRIIILQQNSYIPACNNIWQPTSLTRLTVWTWQ